MEIINFTTNKMLASSYEIADNFLLRFLGLMGRDVLDTGNAIVFIPCNSVHTFFMKFPIDVIFLDKNNYVVHITKNLQKNSISQVVPKAYKVIELPTGLIESSKTKIGDLILFKS